VGKGTIIQDNSVIRLIFFPHVLQNSEAPVLKRNRTADLVESLVITMNSLF